MRGIKVILMMFLIIIVAGCAQTVEQQVSKEDQQRFGFVNTVKVGAYDLVDRQEYTGSFCDRVDDLSEAELNTTKKSLPDYSFLEVFKDTSKESGQELSLWGVNVSTYNENGEPVIPFTVEFDKEEFLSGFMLPLFPRYTFCYEFDHVSIVKNSVGLQGVVSEGTCMQLGFFNKSEFFKKDQQSTYELVLKSCTLEECEQSVRDQMQQFPEYQDHVEEVMADYELNMSYESILCLRHVKESDFDQLEELLKKN